MGKIKQLSESTIWEPANKGEKIYPITKTEAVKAGDGEKMTKYLITGIESENRFGVTILRYISEDGTVRTQTFNHQGIGTLDENDLDEILV